MPWSNQSGGGGPWGSGSGGNGGGGRPGGGGPWGGGPAGGGPPPDLEDWLRRSKDGLKNLQGGGFTPRNVAIGVVVLLVIWLLTGFYRVQPNEIGLNLVFGKFQSLSTPGLRYNIPYPIGSVEKPSVTTVESLSIGNASDADHSDEMLTGDENLVNVDFTVQWQVNPAAPQDFQFNLNDPRGTIRAVAESAMREAIGQRNIGPILTDDRQAIEQQVQSEMQKTLDGYKAGVLIQRVQLQPVTPPAQVIGAFRDVQAAQADQDTAINQAKAEYNKAVPEAKGQAVAITQKAEAYRTRTLAEATGEAKRFNDVLNAYRNAPDITRQRMYLETVTKLLGSTNKIIIDGKGAGQGIVPYLPLDQLLKRQPLPPAAQGTTP